MTPLIAMLVIIALYCVHGHMSPSSIRVVSINIDQHGSMDCCSMGTVFLFVLPMRSLASATSELCA